ncbi:hypothetical protein E3N88_34773 [Mikania micrantha]|uniref:Uncharacterized protein n=1 Tax=Mikania micrantha TaxID=192012 RepID=A0A5N6M1R5_9ASTR|nr:hypothetical protein E3N88_34773 [Mikania micrantha]
MNDYEKIRLLRVQENQERLRELGVKSMAKSLTSLVESNKRKKKKVNPTYFNMKDVNYSHPLGDDSNSYPEVATNVQIAKKQHRPRYIAPMSMTKIANVAKQRRVIAPNVLDSNLIKDHQNKATLTMGELISSNKGTMQKKVFSKNLENSTLVKHRSKKHLVFEKYDVPDVAKTWVLKTIGKSYKVHKCRFKQKHFYQFKDNKTRWNNRPNNIPEDDFRQLLRLWSNKDVEKRCARAKQSRMSQKNMHTAGPKSFARIQEEMKNDDPNQKTPTLTQLFERTRKRTEGRTYVDIYDDTTRKIDTPARLSRCQTNVSIDPTQYHEPAPSKL